MRLTVFVIRRKMCIQAHDVFVQGLNQPWVGMDHVRESHSLLRARLAKVLNDIVIAFIWREGLRPAQTPVTRPGRCLCELVLDSERGKEAHGGYAKGIPRNWCVFPFSIPMKVPSSRLTSGSLGREGAVKVANASSPQVSSDFREMLESCTVICTVKEFTGEAREKRARVANKAKVARLTSMTRKGFL